MESINVCDSQALVEGNSKETLKIFKLLYTEAKKKFPNSKIKANNVPDLPIFVLLNYEGPRFIEGTIKEDNGQTKVTFCSNNPGHDLDLERMSPYFGASVGLKCEDGSLYQVLMTFSDDCTLISVLIKYFSSETVAEYVAEKKLRDTILVLNFSDYIPDKIINVKNPSDFPVEAVFDEQSLLVLITTGRDISSICQRVKRNSRNRRRTR